MDIQYIEINKLKFADYNPRKLSKKQEADIAASIQKFGIVDPIVVNKNKDRLNVIIGGHQRVKVAKGLGYKEMPVYYVDLALEQEKELNIRLNKNAGEFDFNLLDLNFKTDDLINWGFEKHDFKSDILSINETHGDDDIQEIKDEKNIKTKNGDIYFLSGKHRIMCGDSLSVDDTEKLMCSKLADLYLSDPPYNVNYEGKTKDKMKILSDNMNNFDFEQFLVDVFKNVYVHLVNGGVFYIWHADLSGLYFRKACEASGLNIKQVLIWNKNTFSMSRSDYHWKHEPCLYGWKDGDSHNWFSDRKQTTVLDFDKPQKNDIHPTMKPVELFKYLVLNSSMKNNIVLDNFLGSGTTLIACEKTDRLCYGMEIDPLYCDAAVNRYVNFCKKNNIEWSVNLNGVDISGEY